MARHQSLCPSAADALGAIKDPSAVPGLKGKLNDSSFLVVSSAALALASMREVSAVPAIKAVHVGRREDCSGCNLCQAIYMLESLNMFESQ